MAISILMLPSLVRARLARQRALASAGMTGSVGYGATSGERALSASLALGIAGLIGTGLATALVFPDIVRRVPADPRIYNIPADPEIVEPVERNRQPDDPIIIVDKPIPSQPIPPLAGEEVRTDGASSGATGEGGATGGGDGVIAESLPEVRPIEPPFVSAVRDPRYLASFQPPYPSAMEREGRAGTCPVAVTIGVSGRVSAVEDRGCSDPAFFRATQRQALSRWRFRPATRGGEPVESTQVLTVRFEIPED